MSEWQSAPLSNLFRIENGFAFKSADFLVDGIPVIKIKNVKAGHFSPENFSYVSAIFLGERPSKIARPGDLLISMSGNRHDGSPETWVGKVAYFSSKKSYLINQRVGALRVIDESLVNARYFGYVLSAWEYQKLFISIATSSGGQANISPSQILSARVSFPPLRIQAKVVSLLSALDDKIELNRQMNETLEASARALFRDWFVDFGPTKAKMAGDAPYLAPDLWALFPERLSENSVPTGWESSRLDKRFDLIMGQSPPGDTYNDDGEGLPFFQGRTDFGFRYPENRKFCSAPTRIAQADDSLISVRAPVGDINMAWEKCCIGRGIAALRHKSGCRGFTYYSAWSIQHELEMYQHSGTVFGAINKKQFEALHVTEPDETTLHAFEKMSEPFDEKIKSNELEIRTLSQIRDLLLPKLMSGEIHIRDAEQTVIDAV